MSKVVNVVENQIRESVSSAIAAAIKSGSLPQAEIPEFTVEIPADRSHGDYAVNAALVGARAFRLAPRKIAEIITENLNLEQTFLKSFEIAGPGFINFTLSDTYYGEIIKDIEKCGDHYGESDFGGGKRVLIEFVSANPTGPMHIGNARGGALGDCLASVMQAAGYYTEREFYINDAGNQIKKFALSLDLRYQELYSEGIEMPEDSYHGQDIIDHAKAFAEIHGDSYMKKSESERRAALVEFALPKNIEGLRRDLLKYRIEYNTWFKESSLHESGAVADIVEKLKKTGHTYESEGAVWFRATDFGCDKDFVLVRANGIVTYVVPDIAYHYNKLQIRKFDLAIDVLGADHHGYVPRLKAALTALGVDASRLNVVLMQMVRLVRDGEVIKASKRSGKAITLVTLLEEVPIDAARFFFNLREPNSHFDFDLDLAVSETSSNPVYYVQYAHARICSMIKNLEEAGIEYKEFSSEDLSVLKAPEERELIRCLALMTGSVISAAKEYNPSVMTRYVVDVATAFHKFYNACPVKTAQSEQLRYARLALAVAAKTVIKNVLTLLGISAPEKM
jgi:arginyl-tRNA synthetase